MKELTDYQKGMVDAICGIFELTLENCDEPMMNIIFEKIEKFKPSPAKEAPFVEESKDEKIRRAVVEAVEMHKDYTNGFKEEIYAWLGCKWKN